MANPEHVALVRNREDWNKWRADHSNITPDLSGAGLSEAELIGVNLSGADLILAEMNDANLAGANLAGADLGGADLSGAYLSEADLSGADLTWANLNWANLASANLTKTILDRTNFGGARLLDAKGLSECNFEGPCVLDISAIHQSGRLPLYFLRGCGLPKSFIEYLLSLPNEAAQFFSCFISYSTKDQNFADRLHADLQARGIRCWFAPQNIQGGRKIDKQINEAIRVCDKLLLILSDASMNSNWVKIEIANARAREEQEKRQLLFPITLVNFDRIKEWKLFDADTGIDSAREMREYFIPDFSNWKDHDSYRKAFDRLLRDLKAETQDKATA
jgi:uncharacterized protein YjbI with pentapeptide repeats